MAFSTPSYSLPELFDRIERGELQLPDFQRTYGWGVDRIRNLIVTVLRGYPIGAMMALDTRNEPARFKPRPLEGAPVVTDEPGLLLLDGQQRLTSLYNTFQGDGLVSTYDFRSKRIKRRFFVDILTAVSEEIMPEEAVFTVDERGQLTTHFGPDLTEPLLTPEAEVAAGCVPVDSLLGQGGADLLFEMASQADEPVREAIKRFHHEIVSPLAGYTVPMIRLGRITARTGIGSIFAQANSAGLQMDIFELLTAMYGVEDPEFSLTDAFERIETELSAYPVFEHIDRTVFLRTLALYVTALRGNPGPQREDVLTISAAEWKKNVPALMAGFRETAEFFTKRAVFSSTQVPYQAQIPPLVAIFALLRDTPEALTSQEGSDRLNKWFWSGIFGELYGSAATSIRSARDVAEVIPWIIDGNQPEPKTVRDRNFRESRLLSIDESTGVWRGFYALLMSRGALDWRTGKPFTAATVEDLAPSFERIFPQRWCQRAGIDPVLADSILNRTPMGKRTEVVLGGFDPSRYLPRVQSKSVMEDDEFDAVLATHELDPALLFASRADDLFADRRRRLIGMVEYAIDKAVICDVDDSDFAGGEEGPAAFATT